MKLSISILSALVIGAFAAQAHADTIIQCKFNRDSGVLESTVPWRNTLGAMADKACLDADIRRMTSDKASGNLAADPALGRIYSAGRADRTVMQMVSRWASEAGYQLIVNGEPASAAFPRHRVPYADAALSNLGFFEPVLGYHNAINEVKIRFAAPTFDGLDFRLVQDSQNKITYVTIAEKPVRKR
jgi:hypothetical protein